MKSIIEYIAELIEIKCNVSILFEHTIDYTHQNRINKIDLL